MKPDYLTEKQWIEVYDKMFRAVLKVFLKNDKTEEDARNIMEKIKEILVKDPELEEQIN